MIKALEITVLIMFLVAASNFFGAEFSSLGTPKMMTELLLGLDMSPYLILLMVMALIFVLGWPLEWVPIVLIVVPVLLPTVAALDIHGLSRYDLMVWFGILVAVNLQTAWLSPPVALSAYFLKGVVPDWDLKDIYLGMMQFMLIQLIGLILIFIFPTDRSLVAKPSLWSIGRDHEQINLVLTKMAHDRHCCQSGPLRLAWPRSVCSS